GAARTVRPASLSHRTRGELARRRLLPQCQVELRHHAVHQRGAMLFSHDGFKRKPKHDYSRLRLPKCNSSVVTAVALSALRIIDETPRISERRDTIRVADLHPGRIVEAEFVQGRRSEHDPL